MIDKATLIWGLNSASTLMASMSFGHCQYISVVECTARKNLPNCDKMIDHYQATFPLAKTYSQVLGTIPTILSVISYYIDPTHRQAKFMLAGGLVILVLGPFTGIFIKPTNALLLDGENPKKKGDDWIKSKLTAWQSLHSVRTLILASASFIYIYGFSM